MFFETGGGCLVGKSVEGVVLTCQGQTGKIFFLSPGKKHFSAFSPIFSTCPSQESGTLTHLRLVALYKRLTMTVTSLLCSNVIECRLSWNKCKI